MPARFSQRRRSPRRPTRTPPSTTSGALTLILHLKGTGFALNRIARELALDLGDAAFRPDCVCHTPGVASGMADVLSRHFFPGSAQQVPQALEGVPRAHPPTRDSNWWVSFKVAEQHLG